MKSVLSLTGIVAMDNNRLIGRDNQLPWQGLLRADMEHFKRYTTGKAVVMGRKTYESIPAKYRPLPDRRNLILSRNPEFTAEGCETFTKPAEIMHRSHFEEICVIGGKEIYELFMPYMTKLIVTHIGYSFAGDTYFPEVQDVWIRRPILCQPVDERNHYSFDIVEYIREIKYTALF